MHFFRTFYYRKWNQYRNIKIIYYTESVKKLDIIFKYLDVLDNLTSTLEALGLKRSTFFL